jgi:hypothetical protein
VKIWKPFLRGGFLRTVRGKTMEIGVLNQDEERKKRGGGSAL